MTAEERGVVDRIINGLAVVLVGDEEDEHHVPVAELPEGAGEGTWLHVRRTDAGLTVLEINSEAEQHYRDRVGERIDRIRNERGGGRFGR